MKRILVHCYAPTGMYTGSEWAEESPLEPGEYLVPENSTSVALPFCPDGMVPFWTGEAWEPREHPYLAASVRGDRNMLLLETDWCVLPDSPLTQVQQNYIRTYRQELRDITKQPKFPFEVRWPEPPAFIK